MANKTVMSLDLCCAKCKKIALHSVTKIEGIDSLSINMNEKTLTVIGEADPVSVANMLRRKFRCATLVSAGPMPGPPPKKVEEKKEKKEEEKKEEKKEKKKEEKKEEISEPKDEEKNEATREKTEKQGQKTAKEGPKKEEDGQKALFAPQPMWYTVCEAQCYPPCPACPNRSEILWPRYENPNAPKEVSYVWNEEKQDPCTTM